MKSKARTLATLASIIGILAFPSLAAAGGHGHGKGHHRHAAHSKGRHGHGSHGYVRSVPRSLHSGYAYYEPYHRGHTYYRPHRHHHEVYYFPVVVDHVVQHRPYYYCGGKLQLSASLRLPNLAIDLGFHPRGGNDSYEPHDYPRYRERYYDHDDDSSD